MAQKMILKCSKTRRLFFSAEEAQEHAEAFGAAYANFEEVSMDSKVWVCVETQRPAYTEAEVARLKQRDPDSKTFEEKTVAYLLELQKKKEQMTRRKDAFFDSVDQKKLEALAMAKAHGRTRSAKALHFTRDKGTIEAAEAWLTEHAGDADIDKITDAFLDSVAGDIGSLDVDMADANADVSMEPDDRKVGDPNPPEIKEKINKDLLAQVMDMGFSEVRAEKALYTTDNAGVDHAVNWLAEHGEDADIDLPLRKPAPPPPVKPKMSKEEAEAKARELQAKLRAKKAEEERLSEKEKERMRVESTKMMVEASEKLKEEERKRAIEQLAREKEAHEKHRMQLKEQLRLDYIERFGCEPPPEEEEKEKSIKEKSKKDQVAFYLNKLKKTYKDSNPEGLKTCLSTLRIYIKNLQENPQELKFKKLKLENKAFQTRIQPFDGAIDLLDALGFEKKEDCLEQRTSVPDGWLCGNAIKFIDLILGQL
eukprot:TRINITY_DN57563_c0_g1_i1.p1 TRINITY_DN57563_c0_g1~~TRINITY_DN57563_c0_g1_i1.p1  ORF type:complete len:480 (-),score=161.07 TRINITY_DN57563_c0_g1_i1:158-1597(-)